MFSRRLKIVNIKFFFHSDGHDQDRLQLEYLVIEIEVLLLVPKPISHRVEVDLGEIFKEIYL